MKKNLFTDNPLVRRRLEDILPTIDLAGNTYTVDLESRALKGEDNMVPLIDLDNLVLDKDGLNYLCFYHLPTKAPVIIGPNIISLPADTIYLKIPDERFLDPIGLARQYGMEDTALLELYPIRADLKAEVIALEDSGLPELIKINLAKKKARSSRITLVCNLFKKPGKKAKGI
ncbi:hypothetical protein [Pedobacter borealis]|uniref:hypothetical protein n=1 Tax=Pedobacter borealis TaxID=475254 RepID=UPI0012F7ADEF|nr:hypothetical protein [Pedobacter borealis]